MPVAKLRKLLDEEKVKYVAISHSTAYTAQEIAASAHIPGRAMAKTVMVKLDGEMAMAVLPAVAMVDLNLLKDLAGVEDVELAGEWEFKSLFPECEPGAMPPFGNLYGMRVFADRDLAASEQIAFNAGSHTELIQLAYADFDRLVQPTIGTLIAVAAVG